MSENWLILADDLTGAADSAVAFAKRGFDTWVTWKDGVVPITDSSRVIAYNSGSRELTATAAINAQRTVIERFLRPGIKLFKKIDSTLRGQPAAEMRMLCDVLRQQRASTFGIVAPAYPALGRTTQDSHIYVDGVRLEETELWARDHTYPTADVLQMLTSVGLNAERVSLAEVRGQYTSLVAGLRGIADSGALAVCDALTERDLECIAAASGALNIECFYVGSGGLAQALAKGCDVQRLRDVSHEISQAGTLIVVGSLASASRAAARELSLQPSVKHVPLHADILMQEYAEQSAGRLVAPIIKALAAGDDALVEIVFASRPRAECIPQLVENLSRLIAPCAMKASAIAATGGETAAAVLEGMSTTGIRVLAEIEPGICLGLTTGARHVPVVTKAGAFGDEGTLVRIAEHLRKIRQSGVAQ